MIKAIELKSTFSFNESSLTEIQSEINALDTKKSNPANSVSAKHLKEHIDICSEFLYKIINHNIRNSKFDDGMKLADITPVHKKLLLNLIIVLSVAYQLALKSSRGLFKDKLPYIWKPS